MSEKGYLVLRGSLFLNRGRLAPKQSKNIPGAQLERRCGLRECDLGRGATQMPVRNERAQAQGTITADPLLASPPPEIAPPCARRATNRLSRTASQGGVGARAKGAHQACLTGNVAAADPGALHNRPPLRPGRTHRSPPCAKRQRKPPCWTAPTVMGWTPARRARIEPTARLPEPTRVPTTPR